MDTDYIAALIRRGDLGRARDVAQAIALLDGGELGRVVIVPAEHLAHYLGCSQRQVERLIASAVRYALVERIGKQGLRRCRIPEWRRSEMRAQTDALRRDIPPIDGGIAPTLHGGINRRSTAETAAERRGPYMAETDRRSTAETATSVGSPSHSPSFDVSEEVRKKKPPQRASSTDSFSNIQSDSTSNAHGWAYVAARNACTLLGLNASDSNGIAAELKKHSDEPDRASALSLLEDICNDQPDGGWPHGGAIVNEIRGRWNAWTSGPAGPAYQAFVPPKMESIEDAIGWDETQDAEEGPTDVP